MQETLPLNSSHLFQMLAFDFHTSETELFDEPILVEVRKREVAFQD